MESNSSDISRRQLTKLAWRRPRGDISFAPDFKPWYLHPFASDPKFGPKGGSQERIFDYSDESSPQEVNKCPTGHWAKFSDPVEHILIDCRTLHRELIRYEPTQSSVEDVILHFGPLGRCTYMGPGAPNCFGEPLDNWYAFLIKLRWLSRLSDALKLRREAEQHHAIQALIDPSKGAPMLPGKRSERIFKSNTGLLKSEPKVFFRGERIYPRSAGTPVLCPEADKLGISVEGFSRLRCTESYRYYEGGVQLGALGKAILMELLNAELASGTFAFLIHQRRTPFFFPAPKDLIGAAFLSLARDWSTDLLPTRYCPRPNCGVPYSGKSNKLSCGKPACRSWESRHRILQ